MCDRLIYNPKFYKKDLSGFEGKKKEKLHIPFEKKHIKGLIRGCVLWNGQDAFYQFQEGFLSKGKLCELITDVISEQWNIPA